jgi:hypothetical protein
MMGLFAAVHESGFDPSVPFANWYCCGAQQRRPPRMVC